MRHAIAVALALLSAPAFAVGTTVGTAVVGNGSLIAGAVNQTLGDKLVTLVVSNVTPPSFGLVKDPIAGPGVNIGTASFGLSVGATIGNGFGNTGGTAGTQAGKTAP